jgi:hypothetical protein
VLEPTCRTSNFDVKGVWSLPFVTIIGWMQLRVIDIANDAVTVGSNAKIFG